MRGGLKENLQYPSKIHDLFYNLLGVKNIQNTNPPILMTNEIVPISMPLDFVQNDVTSTTTVTMVDYNPFHSNIPFKS